MEQKAIIEQYKWSSIWQVSSSRRKKRPEFSEKIDWRKIKEDEECRKEYNNILHDTKEHGPEMTYDDFFDATIRVRKRTALVPTTPRGTRRMVCTQLRYCYACHQRKKRNSAHIKTSSRSLSRWNKTQNETRCNNKKKQRPHSNCQG